MFSTASGVLILVLVGCVVLPVTAQPAIVSEFDLKTVIDRLGDFDYGVQAEASGLVCRVPEDQARTALHHGQGRLLGRSETLSGPRDDRGVDPST